MSDKRESLKNLVPSIISGGGRSVDKEIEEYFERKKKEELEKARLLDLVEHNMRKQIEIEKLRRERESLLAMIHGDPTPPVRPINVPNFKELVESIKEVSKIEDESLRQMGVQAIMSALGSPQGGGAVGSDVTKLASAVSAITNSTTNTVATIINTAKALAQEGKETDKILLTLLLKMLEEKRSPETDKVLVELVTRMLEKSQNQDINKVLVEKLLELVSKQSETKTPKEEDEARKTWNKILESFINAAIESLTNRKSDIEYLAENIEKLRNLIATMMPQPQPGQQSPPLDYYKTLLEFHKLELEAKKLEKEYEKWQAEMAMQREMERLKMSFANELLKTLGVSGILGGVVGKFLGSPPPAQTAFEKIVCDPKQGGCGNEIPVPPGVNRVRCGRCGMEWEIVRESGKSSEKQGGGVGSSEQPPQTS